jgi:hypothetical protein
MLLGLKPGHACDVTSAVTELMVDVAGGLKPGSACDQSHALRMSTLLPVPPYIMPQH